MKDIIIIDIETTGLCRLTSQIVNIGAVHYQSGKEFYVECRPDSTKEYNFDEKAAEINGTDPEEFADRPAFQYAEQKEAVDELEQWVKEVTEGREFIIAGLNISAFDMMVLCRA